MSEKSSHTDEHKLTKSEQMKKNWLNPAYRENQITKKTGKKRTQKGCENISLGKKRKWATNAIGKAVLSERMTNNNPSKRPEVREKISKTVKELHKNPEYRKKFLAGRKLARKNNVFKKSQSSKVELEIYKIINIACPNQYIHNSKTKDILIDHKRPDFINTINPKKLIEFFGHYWHNDEDETERLNMFKKYGYDTLVIWDTDFKNKSVEELITKIRKYVGDTNE